MCLYARQKYDAKVWGYAPKVYKMLKDANYHAPTNEKDWITPFQAVPFRYQDDGIMWAAGKAQVCEAKRWVTTQPGVNFWDGHLHCREYKRIKVIEGGAIHAYTEKLDPNNLIWEDNEVKVFTAYALFPDYVGDDRDIASRGIYIPALDTTALKSKRVAALKEPLDKETVMELFWYPHWDDQYELGYEEEV